MRALAVLLKLCYLRRSFMFTGRKLPLTLAFAVLVAVAIGLSCNGFFTDPTLSSLAIQPPSPQVQVGDGNSITLQAWGTYNDNSRSQIKSGVAWSSSGQGTTVDVDPNTGVMTGVGSGGTATITASAQGISGTAQATAFLGNVSGLTLCSGTYDTGSCPATTPIIKGLSGGMQNYYAKAVSNGTKVDVTTVATWSVAPTATTGSVTCDASTSPAVCAVAQQTTPTGSYVITVTYPGVNPVTATITVN
jgi:trimeric autotransporter adhesin